MKRGLIKSLWVFTSLLMTGSIYGQVAIDDTMVETFWKKWANIHTRIPSEFYGKSHYRLACF